MEEAGGTTQTRQRIIDEASAPAVLIMDCHVLLEAGALAKLIDFYETGKDGGNLIQGPLLFDDLGDIATHFKDTWGAEMWGQWDHDPRGDDPDGEPFEIFAQGLGVFSTRKKSWLRFNEHFRGFGGEECYIHEKYRQAGKKTLCLPFLRWVHRFGRPGGIAYPLTVQNKVRNYVLGFRELGLDLTPVHENFVATGRVTAGEWEQLLADPVKFSGEPKGCGSCGNKKLQPRKGSNVEQIYDFLAELPRDLNEHLPTLREYASRCETVTEFSKRRESAVPFVAGGASVTSYCTERDPLQDVLSRVGKLDLKSGDSDSIDEIDETDMLYIDTKHEANQLVRELDKFAGSVRKYIVLRGTAQFGETSESGNGPGLLPALRKFLTENPEWSVVRHDLNQYGMTIVSKVAEDKPKLPSKITMAANLAKAVAKHVVTGAEKVSEDVLTARLERCSLCELRNDRQCSACGCFVDEKATWAEQVCPIGRWEEPQR